MKQLKNVNNTFMVDEIVEIQEIGEIETVDISVSDDNLFFANGILTHNSGYGQNSPGLDTISESYGLAATCDAIYNIFQSPEDKELGIINIGSVKNRFGPNFGSNAMRINYDTLWIEEDDNLAARRNDIDDVSDELGRMS